MNRAVKTQLAWTLAMMWLAGTAQANLAHAQNPLTHSDISVKQSVKRLLLKAKPLKTTFAVTEPIHFVVKCNKNAYVYILSDDSTGKVRQVFPHAKEAKQLRAEHNQVVPPRYQTSYNIVADHAGEKRFILVAATYPLSAESLDVALKSQKTTDMTIALGELLKQHGVMLDPEAKNGSGLPEIILKKLSVTITPNQSATNQHAITQGDTRKRFVPTTDSGYAIHDSSTNL